MVFLSIVKSKFYLSQFHDFLQHYGNVTNGFTFKLLE